MKKNSWIVSVLLFSVCIIPPALFPDATPLNFNDYTISSYNGEDADPGAFAIQDGGASLELSGNTWKKIPFNCSISRFTVVEFDYMSTGTASPEIGGIGFDRDNDSAVNWIFNVNGTEYAGFQNYEYDTIPDWRHFTVNIGDLFSTDVQHLLFVNDMDTGTAPRSVFRDVMIYDDAPTATLSFDSIPSNVTPGVNFTITVNYETSLGDHGLRGRMFLEIHDAGTGGLIASYNRDNSGDGYEGPTGSVDFTCNVSSSYTSIYFVAFLSPIEFNPYVLAEMETYPRDGSYGYWWTGNGVTHDINYLGSTIISDNVSGDYTYCCGITYEAFMDAWETYNTLKGNDPASIWGLSVGQMSSFRQKWYAADGTIVGAPGAITTYGCGPAITDWDKASRGDLVQIWRKSSSGHSVIFDHWVRNDVGDKITLRYWSSQPGTSGIHYNSEDYSTLNLTDTLFARARKPVDDDDWGNRYKDVDSSATPTTVGASGLEGWDLY